MIGPFKKSYDERASDIIISIDKLRSDMATELETLAKRMKHVQDTADVLNTWLAARS